MGSAWLRKGTWFGVAVVAFVIGSVIVRFALRETPVALANAPTHDVVSRAADSEIEIAPSLASQHDGSLAVTWIATEGGRDGTGKYVGARIQRPGAKLGTLMRFAGDHVSDATVVPLAEGAQSFLVTWLAATTVYSARISPSGFSAPVEVATNASRPRSIVTPNGTIMIAYLGGQADAKKGMALSMSHDGVTFTRREILVDGPAGDFISVCGDDHLALVAAIDPKLGAVIYNVPIDPEGPVEHVDASLPSEHVAREAPACFVAGQEAFVVYGITEKPRDDIESAVVDALVFARSKDAAHTFWGRATHRPSSRLLHPALTHGAGTFTLLAVMGSGAGDVHASAGVITLTADGRSQSGLTRTVIAPVTMVLSHDVAGFMGDSLGLAETQNGSEHVTWAAAVDNAAGESHVALVRVL